MKDIDFSLQRLRRLLEDARQWEESLQTGAYAAAITILRELIQHYEDEKSQLANRAYLLEKLVTLKWHAGAMFGFDIDNGLGTNAHYEQACGYLNTIARNRREIE
jgi:hypothetical protein